MTRERMIRLASATAILAILLIVLGVNWASGKMDRSLTAGSAQTAEGGHISQSLVPLGAAFTYQGEIQDDGSPANGTYDFSFKLFDGSDPSTATQVGATVPVPNVLVDDGIFTVQLDFGASPFTGDARWLEISVGRDGDTLTALSPTQPLTAVPYAIYGEDADANPANELNSAINFTGTTLQITDAGGTLSQNIGTFNGNLIITTNGRLGVREPSPTTDLFITQSDGLIGGTGGASFARSTVWKILHTGSHFSFVENNVRRAYVETGTGSYVVTSDRAQKKDLAPLGPVLGRVMQLAPLQYHYLSQAKDAAMNVGFLAQDVEAIFPDLARTAEDGTMGLSYADFGVLAIASIQEQQAQIDTLKQENESLRAEIDEIKAMLAQSGGNASGSASSSVRLASLSTKYPIQGRLTNILLFTGSNLALLILAIMVGVWLWNRKQKDTVR